MDRYHQSNSNLGRVHTTATASSPPRRLPPTAIASMAPAPSAAISPSTPRRPMAASSSSASSSSVVILKPEDLLDTADSAAVDSRTRWKEPAKTKSTFMLINKPRYSFCYRIPEQYTLIGANHAGKDWVACDVPASKYYNDNVICVYAAAFEAGMRLPFHDLHAAVLQHYGLAPSQLMPNAWRYLNAFVLLCENAQVQPMLPVFQSFFKICRDKAKEGRYHFKPRRRTLSPPDSGSRARHCRLFTGKMPQSPWKDRFFFIQAPSSMPWPCSIKWGTPSVASIQKPVLTNHAMKAIRNLVDLVHRAGAGDTGIDIMKFLSGRNPPVGHLQIPDTATPQLAAVKQEANAAAALTELTRKRKSPEPITPLPALSLPLQSWTGYDDRSTESPTAPAGVGLGHGEPRVTGAKRFCFRQRLHYFAEEASADFDAKEQELQMAKGALEAANTKHAADLALVHKEHEAEVVQLSLKHAAFLALLNDEFQKEKQAEASRSAEELQKAVQDAYDKGLRDMKKHLVDRLLSDSSLPPVDDQ